MAAELELELPILTDHCAFSCGLEKGKDECDCEKCVAKRKKRAEKIKRLLELDELTHSLPAIPKKEDVPYFEES